MAKIDTTEYTMIPAIVQITSPDRTDYKQYRTELAFGGNLIVLIPVPTSEVTKKGEKYILTLAGWQAFLTKYANAVDEVHEKYLNSYR